MTSEIMVDGMTCQHCVQTVQKAVNQAGGQAEVDLAAKKVILTYEPSKTSLDQLKQVIVDSGYDIIH